MSVAFPLRPSGNGRYFVDQNGVPFQIHGEGSWDAHICLSQTDWRTYLDDRQARGHTALWGFLYDSIKYSTNSPAPALATGELPFLKNISGGTWTGVFANHDADFAFPNDAYFAKVAGFIDDCNARGIVAVMAYCYAGFNQGSGDGWLQTVTNANNTQTACNTFGAYLANGHGAFTGFASRKNIIWICGGDTLPTVGGEGALRLKQMLQGMQANGCNQPVAHHWQRHYLPNDSTDFSSLLTAYCTYSQPVTYAMARSIYSGQTPSRPIFLIEDWYWGEHSVTRAIARYERWAAAITCQCGGSITGFTPFWEFTVSLDSQTDPLTTAWLPSTAYTLNTYVSHAGNWYRATVAGTSAGSGGPTGTGTSIADNTVTWTYVVAQSANVGGMQNLFGDVTWLDHQQMGQFFKTVPWWRMIPESLGGTGAIITAGQGTAATYSDQTAPVGGTDWIVAAASDDKSCLVAFVPDPHSGSFSIDMTRMGQNPSAYWVDPINGSRQYIASLTNTGTHSFTTPGSNSGGDNDWALLIAATPTPLSRWLGTGR